MSYDPHAPCDVPSASEKIAITKLIDQGILCPESLLEQWKSLALHEQDLIDSIARRFYPSKDELEERQNMTRALIIFTSITPEKYQWVSRLEQSFSGTARPKELPPT